MRLSKTERAAYEQTIKVLLDEIYWLRSYVRPESVVSYAAPVARPDDAPWATIPEGPDLSPVRRLSDDEEVIAAMVEEGQIDTSEAEALLQAIGAQNTEIEFAS